MTEESPELRAAIEQCAAVLIGAGFPGMPGRALVYLLAADDDGLTAAELGERLGASPAGVSGAVRYLETVGVVTRRAQAGSRRMRWAVMNDSWYTVLAGQGPLYARVGEAAERIAGAFSDRHAPGARRAAELAGFFRFLQRRMPDLLEEWAATR
ncbi:MAG: MarR family transcriptional regulator [Microbacteriaceae bacterium]|nr:MarR family transcriptional regulator [Microbacteriaceae bacterium]